MKELTHFDNNGNVHMVDVGNKPVTYRTATATGCISMLEETMKIIQNGDSKKGDVLGVARIAGIQGAKRTYELIPLCHTLALNKVTVDFNVDPKENVIHCMATTHCDGKTGVEMEALTAVSIALLTIYDMCKSIDRGMVISNIRLLEKLGGKSGHWTADY